MLKSVTCAVLFLEVEYLNKKPNTTSLKNVKALGWLVKKYVVTSCINTNKIFFFFFHFHHVVLISVRAQWDVNHFSVAFKEACVKHFFV